MEGFSFDNAIPWLMAQLPNVIGAAATLIIGFMIAGMVTRGVKNLLRKSGFDEIISSTVANLELGFHLNSQTEVQFALNPVLFHSGGEIQFGTFILPDETGYDTHSARAGLRHLLNENTTISADVVVGDDSTLGASLGFTIGL